MSVTVSMINMKGGVGKSTLVFNLAWYAALEGKLRVLAVDLDPQSNLSQYFMGGSGQGYFEYIQKQDPPNSTAVEIFEQFSSPTKASGSPRFIKPTDVIHRLHEWKEDGSILDLVPSRLELAWALSNPAEVERRLSSFLAEVADDYDLVLIDCSPTESVLTTAAYRASRYIFVPVKPEFLATIGFPLLMQSLNAFKVKHRNQALDMAGIIFNGQFRKRLSPEQRASRKDVMRFASEENWPVLSDVVHHSRSYPAGSRVGDPITRTRYARSNVKAEFKKLAKIFLKRVGL